MVALSSSPAAAVPASDIDPALVDHALGVTRAAAVAAADWAGRGDRMAADAAATAAMRTAFQDVPVGGNVISGEGAKDAAPGLADGELVGCGSSAMFDLAVDPLEGTDLCAGGLEGALSTLALAPAGAMWVPGPAFYMDKLIAPAPARGAAHLRDAPERIVAAVAEALGHRPRELRVIILDKPRHAELIARVRATGAAVSTPAAGDVAGALQVLLPDGDADLLLGIGGAPEGLLAACAARALGGEMQGRVAPQRADERAAVAAAGMDCDRVLDLENLVAADAVFLATGVTGGLLPAPRRSGDWVVTSSLVIQAGSVRYLIDHHLTRE
ncbi:MAG TPA: fructose-bisphosphatase class II [Solirubrobacteraceae bacterium]|nr:fructose-bisphosphatase class II [Solirubrobacteraceae bacterium]